MFSQNGVVPLKFVLLYLEGLNCAEITRLSTSASSETLDGSSEARASEEAPISGARHRRQEILQALRDPTKGDPETPRAREARIGSQVAKAPRNVLRRCHRRPHLLDHGFRLILLRRLRSLHLPHRRTKHRQPRPPETRGHPPPTLPEAAGHALRGGRRCQAGPPEARSQSWRVRGGQRHDRGADQRLPARHR